MGINFVVLSPAANVFEYCENFQNRAYITQTWEVALPRFPQRTITIPKGKLQTIEGITYKNAAGIVTTLIPETDYVVSHRGILGRVAQILASATATITNYLKNIAFNQLYVSYAAIGALIMATPGVTDYSAFTIAFRRSTIEAKLRGSGTVSTSLIQTVASSFTNGEVLLVERAVNPKRLARIAAKEINTHGILQKLKKRLESNRKVTTKNGKSPVAR